MNYNKNNGWYYINGNKKSPSWTGVEFLFRFLTSNKKEGRSIWRKNRNKQYSSGRYYSIII